MQPKSIIGKAHVSVEYNGHIDGPEFQQTVDEWWNKILAPAIEAMVGDLGDDILIRIPEMKFDIAMTAADNWQMIAQKQIISGLEEEIRSRRITSYQDNDIPAGLYNRSAISGRPSARFIDEWLFFLQKGFIPWWSTSGSMTEWKNELKQYIGQVATAADLKHITPYLADPVIADRISQQLSGPLFRRFLELVSRWKPVFIKNIYEAEQAFAAGPLSGNARKLQHVFRKSLLVAAAGNASQDHVALLLEQTILKKDTLPDAAKEKVRVALSSAIHSKATDAVEENTDTHITKTRTAQDIFSFLDAETINDTPDAGKSPDAGKTKAPVADDVFSAKDAEIPDNKTPGIDKETGNAEPAKIRTAQELFSDVAADATDNEHNDNEYGNSGHAGNEHNDIKHGNITHVDNDRDDNEPGQKRSGQKGSGEKEDVAAGLQANKATAGDTGTLSGDMEVENGIDVRAIWEEIFEGGSSDFSAGSKVEIGRSAGNNEETVSQQNVAKKGAVTKVEKQRREAQRARLKDEMYAAAEEGIYIQNAGVVIVAVYLNVFFTNTGVAENDIIVDMPRAIALIHYLACGSDAAEEFEIVLAKILCGIDPAAFVDTSYMLSVEDKAEADQLLEAVIANWDALKNTSPDSLRATFLMREGRLTYENGAWKLYVQEMAFDILIGMIPWNIGMIFLPWMPSILHVNWRDK